MAASISVDNPGGLAAIFFLTVSADIGIPFPFVLDTILFFTTYTAGPFSAPVLLIIIMLLSGRLLGTGIIYWLSRLLGTRFIEWVTRRSRFLRRNLEEFQSRSGKWSVLAITMARLTPGLMQVSSVAAGSLHVRYYRLVLAIILSSIVYDGALIILGTLARLGLRGVEPQYSVWIAFGFVVVMMVGFAIIHLTRRRGKQG
ncbi:DedA family protein [Chloroflexota bacterium]